MNESQLQAEVVKLAHGLGLLVFHSGDSRLDIGPGYVDLTIAGPRGILFAELKGGGGVMQPGQSDWKWMLLASGQPWRKWNPQDWYAGRIHPELRAIAAEKVS